MEMDDVRQMEPDDVDALELSQFMQKRLKRVLFDPSSDQKVREATEQRRLKAEALAKQTRQQALRKIAQADAEAQAHNPLGVAHMEQFKGHGNAKRVVRKTKATT